MNAENLNKMDEAIEKAYERLDTVVTIGGKVYDNEIIIGSSPDVLVGSGVFLNNLATVIDYGATGFTLTDVDNFTIDHQHCYQTGNLLFIHIIFRTKKKIETTGIFNVGTLSIKPAHVHACSLVTANPSVQDDVMKVEPAYIDKDGNISFNLTKSYSSSNYTLDIATFYCTDMTADTPTE